MSAADRKVEVRAVCESASDGPSTNSAATPRVPRQPRITLILTRIASSEPSKLRKRIVSEAVQPALTRLCRRDHRMLDLARVRARVVLRRRVAAERHAAGLAGAEVHPRRADLHAFLALAPRRVLDVGDRVDVRTV